MLGAIVGHLVGDYILQNDWMALNKKARTFPCLVHCLIWAACVCLFGGTFSPLAFGLLLATHFIQDRTSIVRQWMSLIGQDKFATGICAPWSIIVVDNVWHIVTIWAIWTCVV